MKPLVRLGSSGRRDCKKLRFTIYEKTIVKSEIEDPKSEITNSPVAQLG